MAVRAALFFVLLLCGCGPTKPPTNTIARAHAADNGVPVTDHRHSTTAGPILTALERTVVERDAEDLIEMMYLGHSYDGPAYYVARDGNKIIERALRQRGQAARDALQAYVHDQREVFTGFSGKVMNVGELCKTILRSLETPSSLRD
jgi:hypothetical protein